MDRSQRVLAFIAYLLPVVGWIYLWLFHSKDPFVRFHLRQAVGLFLFLILILLGWGVITWILAWIPYAFVFGIALFSLPVAAFVFGVIAWVIGMVHALRRQETYLPLIGGYSSRLPI